jgi:hypothetical protein
MKTELTEERKEELLNLFDKELKQVVNRLYRNWKRRKANKDIKVSSSTIHDPIQLKLLAMSLDHSDPFDKG